MKLLLLPIYTSSKISKCVSYHWLKDYGKFFLKTFPNSFVYCVVPDNNSNFICDEEVREERWLNIKLPFYHSRYLNVFLPKEEWQQLAVWDKWWDWDVVFTTMNNGWWWRCIVAGGGSPIIQKTKILGEVFPLMSFKKTFTMLPKCNQDLRCLSSYLGFDKIYIKTKFEKEEIDKIAKSLLSPALFKNIENKFSIAFNQSKDVDFNYIFSEEAKKNFLREDFTVVYPQRINLSQKRFDKIYNVLWYLFCGLKDRNIKFRVFTNSIADFPYKDINFIVVERPNRQKFWELLKETHLFISWSKEEGMPSALLESIAFGNIGIVKKEKWSIDLFGQEYPFFVNSIEEAISYIYYICDNRDSSWDKFILWYKNWFVGLIENRHNHFLKQNEFIKNDLEDKKKKLEFFKCSNNKFKIAEEIHNSSFNEIDLMNLPKLDVINCPVALGRDVNKTIFSRLSNRWTLKFILVNFFGWKDTEKIGVIKR